MNMETDHARFDRLEQLRVPPCAIDAEQNVLGGLMMAPERLPEVVEILEQGDFYRRDHQLIFRSIIALAEAKKPFDAVTMGDWFAAQGQSEQVAGGSYLVDLCNNIGSAANIVAYAEIVLEKSKLRQAIDIGTNIVNRAFEHRGTSAADILGDAQSAMLKFATTPRSGPIPYADALQKWWPTFNGKAEGVIGRGMPTPWAGLNDALHGLQDGEVVVLAARSNMGKSVAGFQVGRFAALRGLRTLLFSMEMGADAVINRDVAALGEIPHDWMMAPNMQDDERFGRVVSSVSRLKPVDLWIDDSPQLSSRQITARARRLHMQKPVRLLVVDHLHEMDLPGRQGEVIERPQALRDLKALGKELGCPVVVLAQLNRGAARQEGGKVRRPTMADLRGSGGIEEVADVVILMHRWDVYDPKDRPGLVEFIVGKGRNVKTGTIVQQRGRFDIMRIDDWNGEHIPEEEAEAHAAPRTRPFNFNDRRRPQARSGGRYNPDEEDNR